MNHRARWDQKAQSSNRDRGGVREDQGDYPVQAQRILVRAAEADPPREAALAAWVHRGAWGHPVGPDREAGWDHQAAREAADNRRVVIKSMRGVGEFFVTDLPDSFNFSRRKRSL